MTHQKKLLLETLLGHLQLLEETHPRKAATPLARRTRRYARLNLRKHEGKRMAA